MAKRMAQAGRRVKRGPGRPPSPSTAALRRRLQRDHDWGGVQASGEYVRWLAQRASSTLASVRQTVYRELRNLHGTPAQRRKKQVRRA
jgi:hypothetical protein